jgi:hypothetical protein
MIISIQLNNWSTGLVMITTLEGFLYWQLKWTSLCKNQAMGNSVAILPLCVYMKSLFENTAQKLLNSQVNWTGRTAGSPGENPCFKFNFKPFPGYHDYFQIQGWLFNVSLAYNFKVIALIPTQRQKTNSLLTHEQAYRMLHWLSIYDDKVENTHYFLRSHCLPRAHQSMALVCGAPVMTS